MLLQNANRNKTLGGMFQLVPPLFAVGNEGLDICRQFDFSRCSPETGRFGRLSGPRRPKWSVHFLHLTQKEQRAGRAGCTQVTLFPYNCWVRKDKTRFGPVSGVPGPKHVLGNGRKWPKVTGRNCAAVLIMQES